MARERRWPVAVALVVLIVVTLGAAGAALTYTSLFDATRIRVEGSARPDATVISAAGLDGDVNVFHVDTRAAEAALLADPWIRSADVRRRLPHGLVIHVDERVPVLAVGGHGFAADGTDLPGADLAGLPLARATTGEVPEERIPVAAAASGALTPALRADVGYVVIAPDGELSLRLEDGPTVRWGTGGDVAAKAAALEALLRYADERDRVMLTADVSAPNAPSARFAD